MKVIAYYILHYGKEWLYWSLRSILSDVDAVLIVYTPKPSFGHSTTLFNPDGRGDLINEVTRSGCTKPIIWNDFPDIFSWEGKHRDYAVNMCKDMGADIIVVVDADEIWYGRLLANSIHTVASSPEMYYRIGMRHFWKSIHWVCDDPAMPLRFIKVNGNGGEQYLPGKVLHMGYAQTPELIKYKMSIHGHKGEIRPGWYDNIYKPWTPENPYGDVHPTNIDFWNPEKLSTSDEFMYQEVFGDHPYKDIKMIG